MSNRVHELFDELKRLHDAKNSDYADSQNDPFRNFREAERIGILPWLGVLVRMGDKWQRICNLSLKLQQNRPLGIPSESLIDSLKDLAVYSLICIALYEESQASDKF